MRFLMRVAQAALWVFAVLVVAAVVAGVFIRSPMPSPGVAYKDCADGSSVPVGNVCPSVRAYDPLVHRARFPDNRLEQDAARGGGDVLLQTGEETEVWYSIGPTEPGIAGVQISAELAARIAEQDSSLEVQFLCNICARKDNLGAPLPLAFDRESRSTTEVRFAFTPVLHKRDDSISPVGQKPGVSFIIWDDGKQFDQVHIPVQVFDPRVVSWPRSASASADIIQLETPGRCLEGNFLAVDAEVSIVREDDYDAVRLKVFDNEIALEINTRLAQQGAGLRIAPHRPVVGAIGVGTIDRFTTRSKETYLELSCLSAEDEGLRRDLRARGYRCADRSNLGLSWSAKAPGAEQEAQRAALSLYESGAALYVDLFGRSGDLRAAMDALVSIAGSRVERGAPVRLRFKSRIDFQNQLLHPPKEDFSLDRRKAPSFFGLVFDLAGGKSVGHCERGGSATASIIGETLYAGYRGDKPADSAWNVDENCDDLKAEKDVYNSCVHYREIRDVLTSNGGTDFRPILAAGDFVSALKNRRKDVSLIWGYLHGVSRQIDGAGIGGELPDPRLIFAYQGQEPELLTALRLFTELNLAALADEAVLSRRPLVGLIACESGARVGGGTSALSFADRLFSLGARAVVSTEAEIERDMAARFASTLIERMAADESLGASAAMLIARRGMFEDYSGNLWTLLFHYAGPHGTEA